MEVLKNCIFLSMLVTWFITASFAKVISRNMIKSYQNVCIFFGPQIKIFNFFIQWFPKVLLPDPLSKNLWKLLNTFPIYMKFSLCEQHLVIFVKKTSFQGKISVKLANHSILNFNRINNLVCKILAKQLAKLTFY